MKMQHIKIRDVLLEQCWEENTALNAHIRREGKSQISDLSFHLRNIQKQEQNKPKVSGRKKTIIAQSRNQ